MHRRLRVQELQMRAEDRDDDIEPDDMLPSVEMTMRLLGSIRPLRFGGSCHRRDLHGAGGVACRGYPSATTVRPGTRQR